MYGHALCLVLSRYIIASANTFWPMYQLAHQWFFFSSRHIGTTTLKIIDFRDLVFFPGSKYPKQTFYFILKQKML